MEWQEISSAETAAAGNAPEMVDDTIYESLYAELKIKCNPNKFMVPYDKERVVRPMNYIASLWKLLRKMKRPYGNYGAKP